MKNFSGVCQAAGADKPLRAFFIWITNIVTFSAKTHTILPARFLCIKKLFVYLRTNTELYG